MPDSFITVWAELLEVEGRYRLGKLESLRKNTGCCQFTRRKTYLFLDWVQVGLSSLWGQTSFFFWAPSTCILLGPGRLASGPFIPTLSTTESLSGIIRANLKACWWEWRYILEMKDMVEMCIFCNIWDVLFDILSKKCKRQNQERPDHKHFFLRYKT